MKKTILLFLLLCVTFGYGQVTLKKTWISRDLKYLRIEDSIAVAENYSCKEYDYFFKDVNISFIEYSYYQEKNHPIYYPYHIEKLTEDSLILVAQSENYRDRIFSGDTILFLDSAKIDQPDFKFQKLFFKTTGGCFGECPNMRIEIDSIGNVGFLGIFYTGKYSGFHQGRLDKKDLKKLNFLLKHAWLDNYSNSPDDGFTGIDQPYNYFVIKYNNIVKASSRMPYFYDKILDFLLNCYENAHLKKVRSFKANGDFGQNKIELGNYKSAKGYPDFRCTFINDSMMKVQSASGFVSAKTGDAIYEINNKKLSVNYALTKLVYVKDTVCRNNDSIDLYFQIFDFETKESMPFSNIAICNLGEPWIGGQTDMNGNAMLRVKKSDFQNRYVINVSYVTYKRFEMDIDANTSKSIKIFRTIEQNIFDYQIRSINKNRIVLTNELGIDLVLEREAE